MTIGTIWNGILQEASASRRMKYKLHSSLPSEAEASDGEFSRTFVVCFCLPWRNLKSIVLLCKADT